LRGNFGRGTQDEERGCRRGCSLGKWGVVGKKSVLAEVRLGPGKREEKPRDQTLPHRGRSEHHLKS